MGLGMSHVAKALAEFGAEDVACMIAEANENDMDPVAWVAHHALNKALTHLTPADLQLVANELKTFQGKNSS